MEFNQLHLSLKDTNAARYHWSFNGHWKEEKLFVWLVYFCQYLFVFQCCLPTVLIFFWCLIVIFSFFDERKICSDLSNCDPNYRLSKMSLESPRTSYIRSQVLLKNRKPLTFLSNVLTKKCKCFSTTKENFYLLGFVQSTLIYTVLANTGRCQTILIYL